MAHYLTLNSFKMSTQEAPTLSRSRELKRWLEDRALENGHADLKALATAAGMSSNKLTSCTSHPEKAHPDEVVGLAKALGLHWFNDLVKKWGFGKVRFNLHDIDRLAGQEGMAVDLVVNQAA